MRGLHFVASCIVVILALSLTASAATAVTAVALEPQTFDTAVEKGVWFIDFYAPWCGFCKRLEPTWNELADLLKDESDVHIAKVNCDDHKSLCRHFGVSSFPTLKVISGLNVYEFPGESARDIQTLKEFALGGYLKVDASEKPTGHNFFDVIMDAAETTVIDLMHMYYDALVPSIAVAVVVFILSVLGSLIILPSLLGFGPSFIIPKTLHLLRKKNGQVEVYHPGDEKLKKD